MSLRVREEVGITIDGKAIKKAVLKPDTTGTPTKVKIGDLTIMLIDREDGFGIRLWDNQRPERLNFSGRVWFPIDEGYNVPATYEPFEDSLEILMQRKNGADFSDQVQGEIHFRLDGQDLSLLVFVQENGSLFTLFHDQTSGEESYPSGRYLLIAPPKEGSVEIDFNRAYNPPCAFTDFATCSLPPAQNRLDVSILAGERRP